MPRTALVGLAAIVAFSLGSLAYVYAVTEPPAPTRTRSAVAAVPPPQPEALGTGPSPEPEPAAPPAPPKIAAPEPRTPAPPPSAEPARGAAVDDERVEAPPPPPAPAQGAEFQDQLRAGIETLRAQVAACDGGGANATASGTGGGGEGGGEPAASGGFDGTVLTLALESVPGAVRIVDARVLARGAATDLQLDCARSLLAGVTIPVSSAEAGSTWEMSFSCR